MILPKMIATDWMVIVDASIQMGEKKCLLVIGCRQSTFKMNRALVLEDLEVLSLRIVSSLNAAVVTQVLNDVASSIGEITCICSDRGSDMLRGIKDFQKHHPETRHISDMAHRIANILEPTLERSKKWKEFREQVTLARRRMQNSLIPSALPPSPRTKARYMNVDALIIWAAEMLLLIDNPSSLPKSEMEELKKYVGWLLLYREDIAYWNRIIAIGKIAREIVRTEGMHLNIVDSFERSIFPIVIGCRELHFADEIVSFLLEQTKGLKIGERLLGCIWQRKIETMRGLKSRACAA